MTAGNAAAKRYAGTWLALIVLAASSLWLSTIALGEWTMAVALLIASAKAALIALFFMHLAGGQPVYRVALLTAVSFIGILALLMFTDVETRHDPVPAGQPAPGLLP